MATARDQIDRPAQPALGDLFRQYLHRQALASTDGLALAELSGEVSPYEAVPVQPVDPRLAWNDGHAAVRCFQPGAKLESVTSSPDWPTLVAQHEPLVSLAFAAGNFPQLVRNLRPLWHTENLVTLRPRSTRSSPLPALIDWAAETVRKGHYPQVLLAIGTLRLAKQFAGAKELLARHRADVPAVWQTAWANEQAALAWHEGRAEEAASVWQSQPDSVPVLFNRGMAALFLGRPADARSPLSQAVAGLADDNAWHHLGRLYLALAELRL